MTANSLSGTVTEVTNGGFKVNGGERLSWSKYGPAANIPRDVQKGEVVTVQIDEKGFIQSVVRNGHDRDAPRRSVYSEADEPVYDRQPYIIRQSCLKAAVQFYTSVQHDPEQCVKGSYHVLQLAEKFVEWVYEAKEDRNK